MKTITKSFTVIIELHIEIDNDDINIIAKVPDDAASAAQPSTNAPATAATEGFLFDGPDAVTIKEAEDILKATRGTIDNMRKDNKLTSYCKGRKVRLDRQEVVAAKVWWSAAKGKM